MKYTYRWLIVVALVLAILISALIYVSQNPISDTYLPPSSITTNPPQVQKEFSLLDTRLLGKVSEISLENNKKIMRIELLQNIEGQQNMNNAAIADGVCTTKQVEKNACLNNLFYIRETGNSFELEIPPQSNIQMFAREPRGGMLVDENSQIYLQNITVGQFVEQYEQADKTSYLYQIPFYFGLDGGKLVRIMEKYVP